MLQLIITDPDGTQKKKFIGDGEYTVGRGFFSDFKLTDREVGKRQLELKVSNGACRVEGVRLTDQFEFNGVRTGVVESLIDEDVVTLGRTSLRVVSSNKSFEAAQTKAQPEKHTELAGVEDTTSLAERVSNGEDGERINNVQGYAERVDTRRAIQERVQKQLDLYQREKLTGMESVQLRSEAARLATEVIKKREVQIPAHMDQQVLIEEVVSESIGLGPLEPLLADESITEVMVNGPDLVYVERNGRIERSGVQFINAHSLMAIIERIVSPLGRRIDEGSPLVDARLADGSRVNAIIPPLSLVGPVLTIRKFSKKRLFMNNLVEMNALSTEMAEFLTFCVKQRKNIVISGGTGSGKTTFLNALSDAIPEDERIVTIEDAAELKLNQRHVISLEARPANVEGSGLVTIRELVKNSLRMRPDRIIVGECRDGAALDMLQAMNTGHDGSLTTGHANSPRDLLSRLEVMCLMSDIELPSRALREQISSAVDIIVQQTRFKDGSRRVTSIVEVDGLENDVILLNRLFEFRQDGIDAHGKIVGHYTGLNQAPQFYAELERAGFQPDRSIFKEKKSVAA